MIRVIKISVLVIVFQLFGCSENIQKPLIDVSEIWKKDTCGIYNQRIQIAPIIVANREKVVGRNSEDIISFFGVPDRINDLSLQPDNVEFVYSTSSLHINSDGTCGESEVRSFALILDKQTKIVLSAKVYTH